jgi:hypothetical protein
MKWGSLVLAPNKYGGCLLQYDLQDLRTSSSLVALSERRATACQWLQEDAAMQVHL